MRDRMLRLGFAAAFVASLLIVQAGQALATAPSSAPTIKSPANGSNVGNANPTLSWGAVGNAVYYHVQISTSATYSSPIYDVETSALQATPPSLLPFSTLYWRVAGEDSSHALGPYATASFTKSLSSAPVTLTPTNGQTLVFPTNPILFSWQPVPGAISYTLQIGNSSDFTSNPVQYQTSNTSYTLTDTQSFTESDGVTPQSWWWEVQANYANASVTQWSTPQSYQISWPATPQLESPSNGAVGVTDTVFSWDPVLGAASYDIQVSSNGDWQNGLVIYQTSVFGTRFAPDQTLNNASYYWRVRARAAGSATNYGQWSTPFTFTRSWSSRPVPLRPLWAGGSADPPIVGTLELSWTPAAAGGPGWVDHASHYDVEIGTDLNFSPGTYTSCMTDQTTFTPYNPVIGGNEPGSCNGGPSLTIGTIYYWRVQGIDGPAGVLGLWDSTDSSNTQRFIYQPSLPDLSCGPANGSTVQTPVLCWSAVSGAETYRVTILNHNGTQADAATTYGLTYTPLQTLNPASGPFTWHVETIDSQGDVGLTQASSTWPSFSLTTPTTDTSLSLLTPADGASALRMPSMTWTPYTGASYYEVLVGVTSGIFDATPLSGGTHLPYAGFTYTQVPKAAAKYYWEVEAFDAGNNLLGTSSERSFYVGTTPSYGDWIIPWNDYLTPECQAQTDPSIARCTPLLGQTQEMTWTPEPNAGAYLVYVAKDVNFTNIYREYETGQTSLTPRESWLDSQAGESYYWFVRPCVDWQAQHCGPGPDTNAGLDDSSAYRKSSPAENGLTTTTAANPPVAATTIPNQVTFNWADYMTTSQASPYPVTGMNSTRVTQEAKQYTIQVSTASDFSNIIDTRTVDQTQYTPWTETYPEGPLYWRVQALDGSGNPLTMSATGTVVKASPPIALTSPANAATVTGVPYFTWAPQTWAAKYTIEVYKNGDLNFSASNLIFSVTTFIAAWSPTANMPAGVYAWRVQRLDASNRPGPWSTGRTFTLKPSAPTLNTPADQAFLDGINMDFTWLGVQGAVAYQFQSSTAADFSTGIVENQTTVMTAWSPTRQYSAGVYYWRVNLLDASNNVLSTSSSRKFTVGTLPGAPTGPTAIAGNTAATVSWTAPSSSGSSTITGYIVTSTPGGKTCTTTGATHCTVSGLTNGTAYTFHVQAITSVGTGPASAESNSVVPSAVPASTYHATSPARVLDSRPTGSGHTNIGLSGKFTAGTVRTFAVAGVIGVGASSAAVPTDATAVTGNLTIVNETAPGVVALGPTMTASGATTTINFVKGDIRANNVTLALGAGGKLSAVYRSATGGATIDLIFDVTGFFTPDTSGATYHVLTPGRILDTRPTGSGHTNIGLAGKFANKSVRTFAIAGVKALGWTSALVPSAATAVTGNLTVTDASSIGYVSVGPTIAAVPSTSTLNVAAGATVANGVTVALKSGKLEAVWDGTAGSSADVIFDVTGYFTAGTGGLSYYPITPVRVLDSSVSLGLSGTFASRSARLFTIGGTGGVPTGAAGISGNLTVLNPSSAGWALVSPEIVATPTTSTLNVASGHSEANGFDVALGLIGSRRSRMGRHHRLQRQHRSRRHRVLEVGQGAAAVWRLVHSPAPELVSRAANRSLLSLPDTWGLADRDGRGVAARPTAIGRQIGPFPLRTVAPSRTKAQPRESASRLPGPGPVGVWLSRVVLSDGRACVATARCFRGRLDVSGHDGASWGLLSGPWRARALLHTRRRER